MLRICAVQFLNELRSVLNLAWRLQMRQGDGAFFDTVEARRSSVFRRRAVYRWAVRERRCRGAQAAVRMELIHCLRKSASISLRILADHSPEAVNHLGKLAVGDRLDTWPFRRLIPCEALWSPYGR
jgi:hypothetical protein